MVELNGREVSEFSYASSLTVAGQAIVPAYGTTDAAVGKYKRVRITDLKVSCAGTACNIELGGTNSQYSPIEFRLGTSTVEDFSWNVSYPLDCTSATAAPHYIYASSSDVGVKIVVSGYYDVNEI